MVLAIAVLAIVLAGNLKFLVLLPMHGLVSALHLYYLVIVLETYEFTRCFSGVGAVVVIGWKNLFASTGELFLVLFLHLSALL